MLSRDIGFVGWVATASQQQKREMWVGIVYGEPSRDDSAKLRSKRRQYIYVTTVKLR